jgi:hypothetical protein
MKTARRRMPPTELTPPSNHSSVSVVSATGNFQLGVIVEDPEERTTYLRHYHPYLARYGVITPHSTGQQTQANVAEDDKYVSR